MRSTLVFASFPLLPVFASSASPSSPSTSTSTSTNNTAIVPVCYNLDGSEAPDNVPCGSGDVVNCCNANDICMSSGLCYRQGDRGQVLSRGSCTDHNWGPKCYAPCSDHNRDGDIAIVQVEFDSEEPEYCCGAIAVHDDDGDAEVSCEYGDGPFRIPVGEAIHGVAGLAEHSTDDDDHDDDEEEDDDGDKGDDNSHLKNKVSPGLAVALGLGIPLGLLVMGGLLWAVWERRRRQLKIEEAEENGITGMKLGLHHRYGPIPSPVPAYSRRGTPTQSGVFQPIQREEQESDHGREHESTDEEERGERRGRGGE